MPGAAQQIIESDLVIGSVDDPAVTPAGLGSLDQPGGVNADHQGDPAFDTADFGFNAEDPANDVEPGNLRVDYVLPSRAGFNFVDGAVIWPAVDDPFAEITDFPTSDHRLVQVDLELTPLDTQAARTVAGIELIGAVSLATGVSFLGTEVGGLSGITYDPSSGLYFAIADAQSDYRFYTLQIDTTDGALDEGDVEIVGVTRLRDSAGALLADGSLDPEGIALTADGTIFVTSEGFAGAGGFVDPEILEFTLAGDLIETPGEMRVWNRYAADPDGEIGIRNNLAHESATITPDGGTFYTALENAVIQDGPIATPESGSPSRIVAYDLGERRPVAEYVYENDPVPNETEPAGEFSVNGLVELLALDDAGTLLVLERDFSVGVPQTGTGHGAFLYEISTADADDVIEFRSLTAGAPDATPVAKELLVDFSELGVVVDNVEGLAWGPDQADGRRTLLVVSDNNFSETQSTQVLAFAVDVESAENEIMPMVDSGADTLL